MITRDEHHVYHVDGVPKPDRSVTQQLKSAGIIEYSDIPEYYRDRGTRAHDGCTLNAQGWISPSNLSDYLQDDVIPCVETFASICEALGLSYVSVNGLGYDKEYDICGEYDLIMMWNGKRTLVELKTGQAPMWLGLQLASYERMVEVDEVMGISLKEGKVFVKGDNWPDNHKVLEHIHDGTFDLELWKSNKKRRCMKVLKERSDT